MWFTSKQKQDYRRSLREEAKKTGLLYCLSILNKEDWSNGFGDNIGDEYVQYFCKKCDGKLTPGPSGAGTNQICETCKLNYGCLPNALER